MRPARFMGSSKPFGSFGSFESFGSFGSFERLLSRRAIRRAIGWAVSARRSIDGYCALGSIGCRPRSGRALDSDRAAVPQQNVRSRSTGNGVAQRPQAGAPGAIVGLAPLDLAAEIEHLV